ncbi:Dual specificity protein phosphatase 1 [Platanthera guangdongensis]|uniref:protein-tyrosine-phosphatase n=1 Tax=Platanthera guangdongensis TaxID=2320717 RepID=A0ABR2MYE4_9ASPA
MMKLAASRRDWAQINTRAWRYRYFSPQKGRPQLSLAQETQKVSPASRISREKERVRKRGRGIEVVFDTPDANLKDHFNECFDFIDEARQGGGGVLVHCFAGRSRRNQTACWPDLHITHLCAGAGNHFSDAILYICCE